MSEEEKGIQFENYQPTGDLEKDFMELSSILGVPLTISHRPKVPTSPPETPKTPPVSRRKESKRFSLSYAQTARLAEMSDPRPDSKESPPLTYIVSPNKEYFKPQILYESENENNKEYPKELYLRGWLADIRVLSIFSKTLPYLEKLTVLDMWNAGLTDDTLIYLNQCLNLCPSLKTLNLNGNHLPTRQRFDAFLSPDSKFSLQNLSLRNCNITEIGASYLAEVLTNNSNLLTLNLCYNNIGDSGFKHLANCLRYNRALLSLDLGSNGIGDEGVTYIKEALTTFPLTHEQVVTRRKLLSSNTGEDMRGETPPKKTPLTTSQGGRRNKAKSKGKDTKRDKTDNTKNQKAKKLKNTDSYESPPPEDVIINPLCEKAKIVNGELWISGNRTLININLSRNQVTKVGLEVLHSALILQGELMIEHHRPTESGLLRLSLQRNCFQYDDPTYVALCELMKKRDPLNKPPVNGHILEDEELP